MANNNINKSLITLKTFQKIGTLAYHSSYNSTRAAVESILGIVPDISNISEEKALKVVLFLEEKIEQSKRDKTYREPSAVIERNSPVRKFGLENKKKIIVIE